MMYALWSWLLLLLGAAANCAGAAPTSSPPTTTTWAAPQCKLSNKPGAAIIWFADIGEKVLQHDLPPAASCGAALRISGARGEHVTLQIAVRSSTAADLHDMNDVQLSSGSDLGRLVVQREAYTLVTTAASNVTSRGVGMYPDPLPFANDTRRFPHGVIKSGETAVFWLTLGPIPIATAAGRHTARLSVGGNPTERFAVELQVWNFTLPDAAHASQHTEADPFAAMTECNILASIRPKSCYPPGSFWPQGPHKPGTNLSVPQPCLQTSVVEAAYRDMYDHRINRNVWAFYADFAVGVGLTIANDTQSMEVDMAAFNRMFEQLVQMGYGDLKLPIPGSWHGGSYQINFPSPNATFTFVNSSVSTP